MSTDDKPEFRLFTEDLKVFHLLVREGNTNTPYERCRHLWICVLLQQVRDAFSMGRTGEAKVNRQNAIHWLLNNNPDFTLVCYHAGFNPTAVRQAVKKLLSGDLSRDKIYRLFPGTFTNGTRPQQRGPKAKTFKELSTEK